MKALILAGGKGTRLYPTTQIYNKHLIHVYDKPMIIYAIENLKESGITDIILSVSKDKPELFMEYLQDGSEFGVNLTYIVQNDSKGIAYAINQAKYLLENDKFLVYLADNYFNECLAEYVGCFENMNYEDTVILVKEYYSTRRYGVAFINSSGKLVKAIEKPSDFIVQSTHTGKIILGAYLLSPNFFDIFKNIKPSQRNEYEITDALNELIPNVYCMDYKDTWYDLGTQDDILKCSNHLQNKILNKG